MNAISGVDEIDCGEEPSFAAGACVLCVGVREDREVRVAVTFPASNDSWIPPNAKFLPSVTGVALGFGDVVASSPSALSSNSDEPGRGSVSIRMGPFARDACFTKPPDPGVEVPWVNLAIFRSLIRLGTRDESEARIASTSAITSSGTWNEIGAALTVGLVGLAGWSFLTD